MPKGYDISTPGGARKWARQISRNVEKGFAKHPVEIPFQAAASQDLSLTERSTLPTHVVHIHGGISESSVVMGNGTANLSHSASKATGNARLEAAITRLLEGMPQDQIPSDEAEGLRAEGERVLDELRAGAPDESKVARAVQSVRRILTPIATAAQQGAAAGAHAWARGSRRITTRFGGRAVTRTVGREHVAAARFPGARWAA